MSAWKLMPGISHYFVTTTIVEWVNVFETPETFQILVDSLDFCNRAKGLSIHAYVIMPNHFHAVLSSDSDHSLSDILRDLKRHSARRLIEYLERTGQRRPLNAFRRAAMRDGRGNVYKVWQEGFHPIGIFSDWFLRQKVRYIHQNPVRKGLVRRPQDWRYSSARNYFLNDHSVLKVQSLFG